MKNLAPFSYGCGDEITVVGISGKVYRGILDCITVKGKDLKLKKGDIVTIYLNKEEEITLSEIRKQKR